MSAPTGDFNTSATLAPLPYNSFYQAPTSTAAGPPASSKVEGTKKKGDKTHPCPVEGCVDKSGQPRMFACPHNVAQHVREKHTDERPYKCGMCPNSRRGFNRPFTLNRHMLKLHDIKIGPGKGHGSRRAKKIKARTATSSSTTTATSSPTTTATPSPYEQAQAQPSIDFNAYTSGNPMLMQTQDNMNDNTAFLVSQCKTCNNLFFDVNSVLMHHHTHHGEQTSPFCTCTMCNSVYRDNAADMIEITQQLEAGGFGLLANEAEDTDLDVLRCEGSHYNLEGLTTSSPAKTSDSGFVGMFADELFTAQIPDGGEEGMYGETGGVSCSNDILDADQLGDIDLENTVEYSGGGGIDCVATKFEGMDSGDEEFDFDSFIDMNYVAATEAINVNMVETY